MYRAAPWMREEIDRVLGRFRAFGRPGSLTTEPPIKRCPAQGKQANTAYETESFARLMTP